MLLNLRRNLVGIALWVTPLAFSTMSFGSNELETVESVDLARYAGRWYEIAALPQVFELGCINTQANYTLRNDGKVDVVNSCNRGSPSGPLSSATGIARVVDPETNAKLKVSFYGAREGDYWILALADDYSYALVGAPGLDSLWILARQPSLDQAIIEQLLAQAELDGFPVENVRMTRHEP